MRFGQLVIQNIIWRGLYFFSVFILNILISRYFKADGSGWIFYVINNLSFVLLILSLCLESGSTYYIATGEINSKKIATFSLLWSVIASLICFFLVKWTVPANHPFFISNTEIVVGYMAYVLGVLLTTYFNAIFFSKQNFFTPNIILFSVNLLIIMLLIIFGKQLFVRQHFLVIYFASFFLQGLLLVFGYYSAEFSINLTNFLSFEELKKILNYSKLALVTNIVFFLVYRVDYWFVKRFCTEHDLGNYIQVSKLGQLFLAIPVMIAAIIFPRTATGVEEMQIRTTLQTLSRLLFTLYAIIILGIILTGQWLFPFLFGTSFNRMYLPFLLMVPGILFLSSLALLIAWNAGKNRVIVNLKGSLIALVIIISGDWFLIPSYGIRAAAAVSSTGYISYLVYVLSVSAKEFEMPLKYFFVLRKSDINWIRNILHNEDSSSH